MMNDMVKALRCMASQNEFGDCYKEQHNARGDDEPIYCSQYKGPNGNPCPFFQDTYGVCFEEGEHCEWMGKAADLLEQRCWIPTAEQLPPKPTARQVLSGDTEYIVTIKGAKCATVLQYLGKNEWVDERGNSYKVTAWMPLPEAFKEDEI